MGSISIQLVTALGLTSSAAALLFLQRKAARVLERQAARCRACGGTVGGTCTCDRRD